jgi:hypothetical protein
VKMSKYKAALAILVWLSPGAAVQAEVTRMKVLVRVADFPIIDSDRDLEYFLRNPAKFRGSSRPTASAEQLEELLNRLIVETMIFEENKVVGSVELSATESLALLKNIKTAFGARWREFLVAFDQDENSIKERLQKKAVCDKVIQKKLESVIHSPGASKSTSDKAAQKSVDDWLKQLRGRYKVQTFE